MRLPLAAAAGLTTLLWATVPPNVSLCGFHWLTGRPCPLCGLTRSLFALAKGHLAEALHWHALAPLAAAMLLTLGWEHPMRGRLWRAGGIAFAIYGVWRVFLSPLQ